MTCGGSTASPASGTPTRRKQHDTAMTPPTGPDAPGATTPAPYEAACSAEATAYPNTPTAKQDANAPGTSRPAPAKPAAPAAAASGSSLPQGTAGDAVPAPSAGPP